MNAGKLPWIRYGGYRRIKNDFPAFSLAVSDAHLFLFLIRRIISFAARGGTATSSGPSPRSKRRTKSPGHHRHFPAISIPTVTAPFIWAVEWIPGVSSKKKSRLASNLRDFFNFHFEKNKTKKNSHKKVLPNSFHLNGYLRISFTSFHLFQR